MFENELVAKFDAERARLAASHKVEMDNLVQKCHALKVAHDREQREAFTVLKLKYSNLDKDASHAFLMEFKSPPICDVIPTSSACRRRVATRAARLRANAGVVSIALPPALRPPTSH